MRINEKLTTMTTIFKLYFTASLQNLRYKHLLEKTILFRSINRKSLLLLLDSHLLNW